MLVTQNIDDLHTQAMAPEDRDKDRKNKDGADFAFRDAVYEIHGNVKYMRCPDFCDSKWYESPSRADVQQNGLPKCKECAKVMKPHAMLFDEFY